LKRAAFEKKQKARIAKLRLHKAARAYKKAA
jgi:hypothetical protein